MKKAALALALLAPTLAFSLLPPLYETLAEFKSLINDERLPKALQSGEAIISIEKAEDIFIVTTNKHTLKVKVVREPTKLIGPGKFHLEFPEAHSGEE